MNKLLQMVSKSILNLNISLHLFDFIILWGYNEDIMFIWKMSNCKISYWVNEKVFYMIYV